MLVRYLRDRKGRRRGIVVATDDGRVGWSLCRKSEEFDREKGMDVAVARANNTVPHSMRRLVTRMEEKVAARNNG